MPTYVLKTSFPLLDHGVAATSWSQRLSRRYIGQYKRLPKQRSWSGIVEGEKLALWSSSMLAKLLETKEGFEELMQTKIWVSIKNVLDGFGVDVAVFKEKYKA